MSGWRLEERKLTSQSPHLFVNFHFVKLAPWTDYIVEYSWRDTRKRNLVCFVAFKQNTACFIFGVIGATDGYSCYILFLNLIVQLFCFKFFSSRAEVIRDLLLSFKPK